MVREGTVGNWFVANVHFEISGNVSEGYKRYIINGISKENRICCVNKGEGEIGAERVVGTSKMSS